MNLFYSSSKIWGINEEADYEFNKGFTIPLRGETLFVKVMDEGLLLSPTVKGLKEHPGMKQPVRGLRKLLFETLLNWPKPYMLKFSDIKNVAIDKKHGRLEIAQSNKISKFRIVKSMPLSLEEASQNLTDILAIQNVSVTLKDFKFYEIWNKAFLIFITLSAIIIVILIAVTQ